MVTTVRLMTVVTLLLASKFVVSTLTNELHFKPEVESFTEENLADVLTPLIKNEQYIRQIHSMYNAYKGEVLARRVEIKTKDLIDLKFKTGKRNVDLINVMLSLPQGMNDAGR